MNRRIALLTAKYLVDPNVAFITILGPRGGPAAFVLAVSTKTVLPGAITRLAALTDSYDAIDYAALTGDVEALERLYSSNPGWRFQYIDGEAVRGGHLNVVKWVRTKKIASDPGLCYLAAEYGHLHILRWARAHGYGWGPNACARAAYNGHLEVLQWMRAHGQPWD
ncbi:MAG: hypothetical protein KGL39_01305 [Patescibacteria group bacterium]|nr:hypothetical protein [Patescibacteria group bacterium]